MEPCPGCKVAGCPCFFVVYGCLCCGVVYSPAAAVGACRCVLSQGSGLNIEVCYASASIALWCKESVIWRASVLCSGMVPPSSRCLARHCSRFDTAFCKVETCWLRDAE